MGMFGGVMLFVGMMASCSQQIDTMKVDVFKLRSTELADHDAAMVRGDQNFVMHGKISESEREKCLGSYYTVIREDVTKPAVVKFHYQQVATRSKILTKVKNLKVGERLCEFSIMGDDYLQNGRVLTWKAELIEEGKVKASRQSFMWE